MVCDRPYLPRMTIMRIFVTAHLMFQYVSLFLIVEAWRHFPVFVEYSSALCRTVYTSRAPPRHHRNICKIYYSAAVESWKNPRLGCRHQWAKSIVSNATERLDQASKVKQLFDSVSPRLSSDLAFDLGPLACAPMVGITTNHFRYLFRLFTKRTILYTEMIPFYIPTKASAEVSIVNKNDEEPSDSDISLLPRRLVDEIRNTFDNRTVFQIAVNSVSAARRIKNVLSSIVPLSSSNPLLLNLNCGCPSSRAHSGTFGLELMRKPELVAEICAALEGSYDRCTFSCKPHSHIKSGNREICIPRCSIKCRLGIMRELKADCFGEQFKNLGHRLSFEAPLKNFMEKVLDGKRAIYNANKLNRKMTHFIVHARAGITGNTVKISSSSNSAKIDYEAVFATANALQEHSSGRSCNDRVAVTINGSILTPDAASEVLHKASIAGAPVFGVMIGRSMFKNPWTWLKSGDAFCLSQMKGISDLQKQISESTNCELQRSYAGKKNDSLTFKSSDADIRTRRDALIAYSSYANSVITRESHICFTTERNARLKLVRPLTNFFTGVKGNSNFKNALFSGASLSDKTIGDVIMEAKKLLPASALDECIEPT